MSNENMEELNRQLFGFTIGLLMRTSCLHLQLLKVGKNKMSSQSFLDFQQSANRM